MKKVIAILAAAISVPAFAGMNRLYFNSLSSNDGLSDNLVYSIAQDKDGFMWFGTSEGLNRYDGYDFNIFQADPDDPHSLSASYINCVWADRIGRLWIATEKGLNRYDYATETFERVTAVNDTLKLLNNLRIRCVYDTPDGTLWLGTLDGLLRLDVEKRYVSFTRLVPLGGDRMSNEIRCICPDSYGRIWLGTFDGLYWFNPQDNSFIKYDTRPSGKGERWNNLINSLYIAPGSPDRLYIGSSDGLSIMDLGNPGKIIYTMQSGRRGLAGNDVKSVLEYSPGIFLIATADGLTMWDTVSGETVSYKSSLTDATSLPDNSIRTMFRSGNGAIWLGTDKGVSKIDLNMKKIDFFNVVSSRGGVEHRERVNDILCHDGGIWVSTNEGIIVYDSSSFSAPSRIYTEADNISHKIVKPLCRDRDGIVWVGTNDGLDWYDSRSGRFVKVDDYDEESYSLKYIYDIKPLPGGGIVTNVNSGLCFIRPETGPDGTITGLDFNTCGIADIINSGNSDVAVFDVDMEGNVWFTASDEGLFRYDARSGNIGRHMSRPGDSRSLPSNRIYTIHVDGAGTVWLGTNRGLCRYIPGSGFFDRFDEDADLSASIRTITSDRRGRIWVATLNKIIMYDPSDGDRIVCDLKHDLNLDELIFGSCAEDTEGNIYMGGNGGFIRFSPDRIVKNENPTETVLTSFRLWNDRIKPGEKIAGKAVLPGSVTNLDRIVLGYDENSFGFSFSLLNFSSMINNRYRYRLEGYDREWQLTGNYDHAVFWSNLSPGRYRFEVQGCNSDMIWSRNVAGIDIRIRPPWWAGWWAWLVYISLTAGAAAFLARFAISKMKLASELKSEKLERAKLEEVNSMKMRFFTNISHEFKTPLSLILGPIENLSSQIRDSEQLTQLQMMKQNAETLLRLVNQVMDLRKYDSGKLELHLATGEFVSFSRMIWEKFCYLAQRRNITYDFEAFDDSIDFSFDGDKIEKVYNNLISNAIKFTPDGGHVSVTVFSRQHGEDREAVVQVSDTGTGVPEEERSHIFERFYQGSAKSYEPVTGSGIGLVLTKEFVELHGGHIDLESREGEGSTFTFVLPCRMEAAPAGEEHDNPDTAVHDEYRILVVEDNPDMSRFIAMSLEQRGGEFSVIPASDGAAGLKKAKETYPDLIISDIMMPVMDGLELCRRIKSDMMTSHIPVILLTAKGDEGSRAEGYAAGADGYINKPFSIRTLRSRIGQLIEQRQRLQERYMKELLSNPSEIAVVTESDRFINTLVQAIEDNIGKSDFGIKELCEATHYTYQQVYRKVKILTGESVNEFIRTVRLKRAAQYLASGDMRITDVIYSVGFNSHSYFTKCFREKFGMSPKEYVAKHKKITPD